MLRRGSGRRRWWRNILIMAVALLLAALPAAGEVVFRSGETVTVAAGEVIDDDLYASGQTITIDGTVEGDLIAAGRLIEVNGTVTGDLIAAAQGVLVTGSVGDDVRLAGQALKIDGSVGDDLIGFGFSLETTPEGRIGGSVTFSGAQARLAGPVVGNVTANGQGLELRGAVGGRVEAELGGESAAGPWLNFFPPPVPVPTVAGGLAVAESAEILGELSYASPVAAEIAAGARVGGETRWRQAAAPGEEPAPPSLASRALGHLQRFLALLLVGLLLLWRRPQLVDGLAAGLRSRPLQSLGWGLVSLVGLVFGGLAVAAVAVSLAILFGIVELGTLAPLTFLLGLLGDTLLAVGAYVVLAYLAQILFARVIGGLILDRARGEERSPSRGLPTRGPRRALALVIGLLLYIVVQAIPFLGTAFAFVVAVSGLGVVVVAARGALSASTPASPTPA